MASDDDSDDMDEWAKLETVTKFECKYILEHSCGAILYVCFVQIRVSCSDVYIINYYYYFGIKFQGRMNIRGQIHQK